MGFEVLKPYRKTFDYSYACGAYAVIEMLEHRADIARAIYIHSSCTNKADIENRCNLAGTPFHYGDNRFNRINRKENCYVVGEFSKYTCELSPHRPHVLLAHPGDMGNLGTIIRTMAGFGFNDLAIITPAADIFDPKAVRASMGSLFSIRFQIFGMFGEYRAAFPCHECFPFMLDAGAELNINSCPKRALFTLVFGNEATGLDFTYATAGTCIKILQSEQVDSLNLSVAAGIGMYIFALKNGILSISE